jgi:hypothetical protein
MYLDGSIYAKGPTPTILCFVLFGNPCEVRHLPYHRDYQINMPSFISFGPLPLRPLLHGPWQSLLYLLRDSITKGHLLWHPHVPAHLTWANFSFLISHSLIHFYNFFPFNLIFKTTSRWT